jgi:hypothetical protein
MIKNGSYLQIVHLLKRFALKIVHMLNSPIRGWFWLILHSRGGFIGGKLSPLRKVGMGLCYHYPYPITMKSPLGT